MQVWHLAGACIWPPTTTESTKDGLLSQTLRRIMMDPKSIPTGSKGKTKKLIETDRIRLSADLHTPCTTSTNHQGFGVRLQFHLGVWVGLAYETFSSCQSGMLDGWMHVRP